MITPNFKEKIESGLVGFGGAVILAGSGSDESHIEKITSSLAKYGILFDVRVVSAHKQGPRLSEIVSEYDSMKGFFAYIAVSGGTDALSGTLSFISYRPVISCPPDHLNMSCLTNPSGSSNAYIARPENAARFIAQMFSYFNSSYLDKIKGEIDKKKQNLEQDDERLRKKYSDVSGAAHG